MTGGMYQKVFGIVMERRSVPLLELSALSELDETQLRLVLDDLEREGLVRITDKQDSFKEVITVKEKAFSAASRHSFSD